MARFPVSTSNEQAIYAALELSKNSWLLAIQADIRRTALRVCFPLVSGPRRQRTPTAQ